MLERTWHPQQRVKVHRDGSLTLKFPAPALFEMKRWVLQWGGSVQVIRPAELRREVRAEALGIVRQHRR